MLHCNTRNRWYAIVKIRTLNKFRAAVLTFRKPSDFLCHKQGRIQNRNWYCPLDQRHHSKSVQRLIGYWDWIMDLIWGAALLNHAVTNQTILLISPCHTTWRKGKMWFAWWQCQIVNNLLVSFTEDGDAFCAVLGWCCSLVSSRSQQTCQGESTERDTQLQAFARCAVNFLWPFGEPKE